MNKIEITGYEQNGHCEHCGRELKHCIKISTGVIVGATCFDKKLTLPLKYHNKPYRLGAQEIIRLAKMVQNYSAQGLARHGIYPQHLQFDKA